MSRKGEQFAGLSVAIITPFRDGQVDFERLKNLVEEQVDAGTECLVPCGTTGESPTLSHEEHERVIETVCKQAAGRILVMAGTGSNSTAEAIRLTKFAKSVGADGSLQVAPYYNKPMQEGFYSHFRAIAEAVDIPIILYNIPGRSAKNIEPETIIRLSEISNIVAVKEATGSLDQASQILTGCDITVLSGDDSLTLPLMSIGASGIVSVVGNIVPADVRELMQAITSGDWNKAKACHHKLFPFCRDLLSLATNPIPVKAALAMLGKDTGEVRLPMTPLDETATEKLRATLKAYGLLN